MSVKAWRLVAVAVVVMLGACSFPSLEDEPDTGRASGTVTRALKDVERFWGEHFPEVADGQAFEPVRGGYHPYTENDPPPACGGQQAGYEPNAFYCPGDDFIAWDAQTLIPSLEADYGPALVGVVMAHEYGHAIQARIGPANQRTVVLEQQADCYAGAWLADVLAGRSQAFKKLTAEQLDTTVAGLLLLRDQPGTPAAAEGAHGNAFDRIRALQEGVEDGVGQCAKYRASNLPVTEVPFSTREEAASGGDLPYDDAIQALATDAQEYWTRTYPQLTGEQWRRLPVQAFEAGSPPSCSRPDASAGGAAFYCADGDFAAFDTTELGPQLHERIGDYAVGMLLGDLFARAAQDRRGAETRDRAGQLAVDCLAGSWTNDILTREDQDTLRLSPGDLDEAVSALLAFGRASDGGGPTAFDRIASYRSGVLEGLSACRA
ncbi:aminopeptidase [Paractinoplanes deccanensis]|uniref:Aminopeptidase n=1 Tax=Paractinoplanes deccanensis TaxID=113561 RepID=A0ABQ3Y9U0_9ACTN|nr:neutral zinc metallopeptidase [Actinoplanes deccanensis]GID76690.1 aminopeptidase [Actinoplanes deccanensis]